MINRMANHVIGFALPPYPVTPISPVSNSIIPFLMIIFTLLEYCIKPMDICVAVKLVMRVFAISVGQPICLMAISDSDGAILS